MKRIVTAAQMKELDQMTICDKGLPSLVLMERAALACVDVLKSGRFSLERVLVLCGSGNNGGDGIAIARLLHLAGYSVDVWMVGNPSHCSEENKIQREIAENYGTSFVNNADVSEYSTIVDAVFGIGLSREVSPMYQALFEAVNTSKARVLSVDIPSGVDGTNGRILGAAVSAEVTVTFAFKKPGLLFYPGAACAGDVITADIGIYEGENKLNGASFYHLDRSDLPKILPKRKKNGNKGTFGKVLLIAGSRTMSGASWMAARACFRTGAGMVKVCTAEENRELLLRQLPEAMVESYGDSFEPEALRCSMEWADVVGIGPGLGQSEIAEEILNFVLEHCDKPLVIDADGLNLLSRDTSRLSRCRAESVITPHPGEMGRLCKKPVDVVTENLVKTAGTVAAELKTICVLKDARTVTALGDDTFFINLTGNSGMATAGSGDVLTGVILGLLAQRVAPRQAAPLGVWLHGRAGDLMKERKGEASLMAQDLIEGIALVLRDEEK